ncbi:MAG: hypothetical protein ACI81W_003790, partial [Saprospiraceae bacterium]
WTGTQHAENVLMLDNTALVRAYFSGFEQLWEEVVPLSAVANKKPPKPAFQKLFQPIIWNVHDLRHAIILKKTKACVSVFKEEELLIWKQCLLQQRHFLKVNTNFFEQHPGDWAAEVFEEWSLGIGVSKKQLLNNYCKRMQSGDIIFTASPKEKLIGAGMVGSSPEPGYLQNYSFSRFVQWFEFSENAGRLERLPCHHFGRFYGSGLRVLSLLEERRAVA